VTNTSKSNLAPRSLTPPIKVVDIRPRSLSHQRLIALLAAVSLAVTLGFLFWEPPNVVSGPRLATDADLSNLFNQNPDNEPTTSSKAGGLIGTAKGGFKGCLGRLI
jgi:hypothetical protein